MSLLSSLRSLAAVLFRRSRVEGELDEELRSHIQERADDLRRSGLSPAEAERQARIEFGGYESFKEECRENLGTHFLETLLQDIGFAGRLLRKSPGFAAVTILTLALGIGANTAVFSVIYAVLMRPLPYTHPEQLVLGFENNLPRGVKAIGCSYNDIIELRGSGIFSAVGGVTRHHLTLTGAGDPTAVATVVLTPEIFSVLEVAPLAGRYLLPDDEIKNAAPVVVLSEGLWRTRFGGSSNLIGSSITLDQRAFTVVGIMPASFRVPVFDEHQEIWIPAVQDPLFSPWIPKRELHWLRVVARLNVGVSLARAQSRADSISRALAAEFPVENGGYAILLRPLQSAIVANVRTPLLVVLAAMGLVLLLACVNIANLLLARATSRTREVALRQALGARRSRIVRQLLTESAVLGLLGSLLGLALAAFSAKALVLLMPRNESLAVPAVHIDGWVLAFALLLTLAATAAFALAPAFLAARSDVLASLKEGAAGSGWSGARLRARRLLAASQIGLAAVLVIGSGLLVRSLIAMTSVNPGFNVEHIFKAQISLPRNQYVTPEQWTAFSDAFLERIQAQPGMQDSAIAVPLPMADGFVNLSFSIVDHAAPPPGTPSSADYVSASPGYFHVMGISLLRGRVFTREDSRTSPSVTIISEAFARFYFGNEDPIGKKLVFGFPPDLNVTRRIVGIVSDVRDADLTREPGPMMYVPYAQAPFWGANLAVRSTLSSSALVATIRGVVRDFDKNLPITDVATMPEILDASVAQPKFRTWLLSGFGVVALLLAAAGVFGVVSYSVASRTKEFGVRAALGASPGSIARMVLKEGLGLGCIGLALGLAAALGFARVLKSELYGVAVYDPSTFFLSAAVLLAVAIVACYLPARRAMAVDPMLALRNE